MTENELSFHEKLVDITSKLKVKKNRKNEFADFKYRNAEDIQEAVKPLATAHQLRVKVTDEMVVIGDRIYLKATASITDGVSTESAEGFAREPESKPKMDASQVTGSTSSYARKYALSGLFLIDDGNDSDGQDNTGSNVKNDNRNQNIALINQSQIAVIKQKFAEIAESNGADYAAVSNHYLQGYQLENLTADNAGQLLNVLNQVKTNVQAPRQNSNQNQRPWEE